MAKKSQIQYGSPAGGTTTAAKADDGAGKPKGLLIAGAVALLAVIIVIAVFAVQDGGGSGVNKTSFSPEITIGGDALPALPEGGVDEAIGKTIPTIAGKDFDLKDVELTTGEPTFIVVMAHWCSHCQAEIPKIVDGVNNGDLSKDVKIFGVSTHVDEARGNFPPASWLDKENWTFPVLLDNRTRDAAAALGISGYPGLIAVNADGVVVDRASGEQTLEKLQSMFAAALGESTSDSDSVTTTTAATDTTVAPQ
ncbi:MAG: TlpA family protein disulfide reductase [Actinobacteria bacterium]|nr:TlpA family protein disulfide reductase [Actinomycetota bacterium]